ncbi:TetR/AcrR family transcriptional regulator [Nocardia sp. NBC_01327]|uniref:TetR/AcrR family transcriptional regulator n=1 Tax=Nocardia sp. NBC_01327 TaxID=2903593 RepID=UPI002E10604B|nr:TetR/AcrR family transcriptional regulator [Nocardia sp. NBC_01327]
MPRVGLTPQRIVTEAATVADEVGLDRLTLATVAKRCGVSLPGLYKHVDGLDAVKRDISVQATRELTAKLAAATSGVAGKEALQALSAAYREYARAYPGRYTASVRAPAADDREHEEVAVQAVGVISAALKGYRLEGADLIHAIRIWRIACHGLASLEGAGAFGLPDPMDETFTRLIDALDASFRADS